VSATVDQIKDDALTLIGQVAGPSTQAYDDDRMMAEVVRSFNLLFKKYPWHQYREWIREELDGVTGLISSATAFADVLDFEDFVSVHFDGSPTPIPILPKTINPYSIGAGSRVRYWTSLSARNPLFASHRLQFYPLDATDFVNVLAKVHPHPTGEWDWDDPIYLDKDMLVYGCAFMTLVNDDLNANAAETCKQMMEMKFRDIVGAIGGHIIPIEEASGIQYEWNETP